LSLSICPHLSINLNTDKGGLKAPYGTKVFQRIKWAMLALLLPTRTGGVW